MKWKEVDWETAESSETQAAMSLLDELVEMEGADAPMQPDELRRELDEGAVVRLWFHAGTAASDDGALHGFALLRPDGTVRTVLREEHREMSIFLPMLQWADARFGGSSELTVLAQDGDICIPFLLLRLEFTGVEDDSGTTPPGWTRFRGGRVDFPLD